MVEDKGKKPATLEELKKTLEECRKKRDEYLAGWQRARADFINYKKEDDIATKAMASFLLAGIIREILSVLDNLELAEKKLPEELKNDEHIKGILHIKDQILDLLKKERVEVIEVKVGDEFDPSMHEAVEQVEQEGTKSGIVVEEVRKGYIRENRIIVPTKVKVSK